MRHEHDVDVCDVLGVDPRPDARPAPRERRAGTSAAAATSLRTFQARGSSSFPVPTSCRTSATRSSSLPRSSSFLADIREGAVADGARSGARDRPLHRHRRLDETRGRARRSCLARAPRAPPRARPPPARPLPWQRGGHGRRRLLRQASTAPHGRSAAPARSPTLSASSASKCAPACTQASASSSTARWPASPCTSAPASLPPQSRARCSSPDSQRPRRRFGAQLRRPRHARAKGRPGEWRLYSVTMSA